MKDYSAILNDLQARSRLRPTSPELEQAIERARYLASLSRTKYHAPHQGAREKARRLKRMETSK